MIAPAVLGLCAANLNACASQPPQLIQLKPGTTLLVTESQVKGRLEIKDGCFVLQTPVRSYSLVATRAYAMRGGTLINQKTGEAVPTGKWLRWEGSEQVVPATEVAGDIERCKPPYFLAGNNNNAWSEK
ncbi:hypothetical protein [Cognatilysobacter terrigena]|uniref:hypothetical protein n=1 Tax=Cognatilysobacter terrigena TaxID=2488749 RepID=UPI001414DC7B|nr:hypothetical protein [Lysobacter terrigena]